MASQLQNACIQIGEVLKRLHEAFDVSSDAQLARKLQISPGTVSSWRARGSIPYESAVEIAEKDGVSLDWLLLGRGPKEGPIKTFPGFAKEIGARFTALRDAESVADFANRLGVRMSWVEAYERGEALPDADYLARIGRTTGADLNSLLGIRQHPATASEGPREFLTGEQEKPGYETRKAPQFSDLALLAECLEALEHRGQYRRLTPDKKARAVALLYELCSLGEEKPEDIVKRGAA